MGFMYIGFEEMLGGYVYMVVFYGVCVVGGVVFIVIGGIGLNDEGVIYVEIKCFDSDEVVVNYKQVIDVVYVNGGKICMQILYIGCYVYNLKLVVLFVL